MSESLTSGNGAEEQDFACEMRLPESMGVTTYVPVLVQTTAKEAGVEGFRDINVEVDPDQRTVNIAIGRCTNEVRQKFIRFMQKDGYEFMGELESTGS